MTRKLFCSAMRGRFALMATLSLGSLLSASFFPSRLLADSVLADQYPDGVISSYQGVTFQGSSTFTGSLINDPTLNVTVYYAVFNPGKFDAANLDPIDEVSKLRPFTFDSTDYVYAYQIVNNDIGPNPQPLYDLSVGFKNNLSAGSKENPLPAINAVGETDPPLLDTKSSWVPYQYYISETDATRFSYLDVFGHGGLKPGQTSQILLEGSVLPPTESQALGYTSYADGGGIPSSLEYLSAPAPIAIPDSQSLAVSSAVPLPTPLLQIIAMLAVIPLIRLARHFLPVRQ